MGRLLSVILCIVVIGLVVSVPVSSQSLQTNLTSCAGEEARLRSIQSRLQTMADDIVNFWLVHGPDPVNGGFYATLDQSGKDIDPRDKGVIQHTRHLWVMSTIYRYYSQSPEVKKAADDLYDFITTHFYDRENKQFHYLVSADGKTVLDTKKALYAQSFAILSLSQYAVTFDNPDAAKLALECFRSCDSKMHCGLYGGFDQREDPGVLKGNASKGTNTHMHMLESLTALYDATGDAVVRDRLDEITNIFITKVLQPGGYCYTRFSLDWTPFGEPVIEYGHDLQVAWLLLDAARALGKPYDTEIVNAAKRMGLKSSDEGYDSIHGGYYFSGLPAGEIVNKQKDWWVQCEALNGLWWMYRLTGDAGNLDKLEHTLDFIEASIWDSGNGEWYYGITADGEVLRQELKANVWKTGYHNSRAMIFLNRWIEEGLTQRM